MATNPDDPQFRLGDMLSEGTSPDMVGPFKPPDTGGLGGAVQNTNNYMVGLQQRDADQKLQSQTEMKTEVTPEYPGGWTTIGLPSQLAQKYMQSVKAFDQIQENYQRMLMENQARQAQGKPWANALATIAGSLAANDPNPITRGLGQAAQQLNPTRAQLQAQQMQLLQGQAQAAGQGLQAAQSQYRMTTDMAQRAREAKLAQDKLDLEERRVSLAESSTPDKAEAKRLENEQRFHAKWDDRAQKRLFDEKAFVAEHKKLFPDASPQELKDQLEGKKSLQTAADKLAKEVGSEKVNEYAQRQKANYDYFLKRNQVTYQEELNKIKARAKDANPKLTAAQLKSVTDGEEAAMLIGNLKAGLEAHPDMFGPAFLSPTAYMKRMVDPMFDEAASRLTADYAHATPIMVKLLGEGARGYSQGQRQWVEEKVPKLSDTPERVRGKIAFMEGLLEAKKRGDDLAYVKQAMAGGKPPTAPAPPSPAPMSSAPVATVPTQYPTATNPKTGEILEFRDGQWQKK